MLNLSTMGVFGETLILRSKHPAEETAPIQD